MALGDLPSVKQQFPDEAHEALRRYVDETTVSVADLMMLTTALSQLAGTFFPALDQSLAERAQLRTDVNALFARVAALEARSLRGTTGTASVSSLLGGATNLTVTLKTAMPSADYIALPIIDATTGVNLSTVTATVTAKTASTVTVRVANSGLALLQTVAVTVIAVQLA